MFNFNFLKEKPKAIETSVFQAETKEEIKKFNINDSDILERLAKIAGCNVEDFNDTEFIQRKKDAQNGESSEWYITKAGVKFYIGGNGDIHLISKDILDEVKKRALEMGMKSIG